jgi:hypothetical protein
MLLLAAAAIAASAPQSSPNAGASVQAMASIRIISGVRLRLGGEQKDPSLPRLRDAVIHTADAQLQPAKLVEFE